MKTFLPLFILFLASTATQAQTVIIDSNRAGSSFAVFGNEPYHVSEHFYTASELGNNFTTAATAITAVSFRVNFAGMPQTFNNVKIYLKNSAASTTATGKYSLNGYTLVYNGSVNLQENGWTRIELSAPFTRIADSALAMLVMRTDGVARPKPYVFSCTVGNNIDPAAKVARRYNFNTEPVEDSSVLVENTYRALVKFQHLLANDISVNFLYSMGKTPPSPIVDGETVKATIYNNGKFTVTNVPVQLTITGSNSHSDTKTIASLQPNKSVVLSFNVPSYPTVGTNNVKVSVPVDEDNSNNTITNLQTVTPLEISYANDEKPIGSTGFNASAGLLLNRFQLNQTITIYSVKAHLSPAAYSNQLYGVVLNSIGDTIERTTNYMVTETDTSTYVTFGFLPSIVIPKDSVFYVGIGQVENVVFGYFPLNYQREYESRPQSYYAKSPIYGDTLMEVKDVGRFMLSVGLTSLLPVTINNFSGEVLNSGNRLYWTTLTETNNDGFFMERSNNGKDFTIIGKVHSKAENGSSATELFYDFMDEQPFDGVNYYRLKQTDKDGKFSYSSTIVLKNETERNIYVKLYPNPAASNISAVFNSSQTETVRLRIIDMNGRPVMEQNQSVINGENKIDVNISNLQSGNYILQLNGSTKQVAKFSKQ